MCLVLASTICKTMGLQFGNAKLLAVFSLEWFLGDKCSSRRFVY